MSILIDSENRIYVEEGTGGIADFEVQKSQESIMRGKTLFVVNCS